MSTCTIERCEEATRSGPGQSDLGGDGGERVHDEGDVGVELHAELGRSAVDVVAVHGAREALVLEFLAHGSGFEPVDHLARAHQRARVHEAGQLVARVEGPVQQAHARNAGVIGVGEDGPHDVGIEAARQQDLGALDGMLRRLRVHLVVEVVEHAGDSPGFLGSAVTSRSTSCSSACVTGSGRSVWLRSMPSTRWPSLYVTRPGTPTTTEFGGTSRTTTEPAPTRLLSPMVKPPMTLAPAPTVTLLPSVGWRFSRFRLVPPSVTPWSSVTFSPISAVSPITTPMPWSMKRPRPMRAAGWISMPVMKRPTCDTHRALVVQPACQSRCATRWKASACTPG